ncbi:PTS sugar transporter subunit IIA [Serratia rhizosphaerae]|uniref:PTS sugar transporter subunit IIA n=1 Tax=Serratia rhizosphaerae TaxID=2597702 RepID=A0ABX6GR00_9GAMM|nr:MULTISPECIES: PTS sugar transporter subunit IIA [Serratia]MBU3892041.1 PTS sugar transporter subunit IIA [Serratia rubidaea]AVJ18605.1 PTS ascorbate transporter subunit IIA [Serratia sp. MYb239]MCA4822638.1 PTS sugar transporter subunit IIA [Serratia rubidaea]MEB6335459.1 PTS sugar transporter subunit IIA [Serratia rhizosphaerae]QHA88675.1 PTS sugar transporter subunit IIA [Serratia rhizosphaerae]
MLKDWLKAEHIQLCEQVEDWRQAITLSAQPLLRGGIISADYLTAIFRQYQTLGPYFVLAPGIAMPHARPEEGAKALGLSLLKLHQGVRFHSQDNDPVFVVVMLSAPDGDSHIELIAQLAELFADERAMSALFGATDIKQIEEIIARY